MKKVVFVFLWMFISHSLQAQYGAVELSSGGFSFVPAFTDTNPNIIITAGTGNKKRLSAHMIGNIRMGSLNPRGFIFISRLKVLDNKFKFSIGTHLPAIQIDTDFQVDTFFAQEAIASYEVSDKLSFSSMYIHGKGRNNDLEIHLLTFNAHARYHKLAFTTQLYLLDLDQTFGLAETLVYPIAKKLQVKAFLNQTLSNGDFRWTLGLKYAL